MIRFLILSGAAMFATSATAHTGHLAEAAGHGHWLGAAAVGAAIAIGLWAATKGRKAAEPTDEVEAPNPDDAQEA